MEGGRALEQLLRDSVESPYLETFQTHLDTFLCHLLWVALPWQEVGLDHLQRFLQP